MAYGRLDIFYPDGRIESHTLEAETVSIGRAAGNVLVLDTDTVSRYHFSITYDGSDAFITDLESENGTFVDGVRLPSHEARLLEGVEEIQVGVLRILYQATDEAVTMPVVPLPDDTQRMAREDSGFSFTLDASVMNVWPASSASVEVAIQNLGEQRRAFKVRVNGVPEAWVRVNRPELNIDPQQTAHVLVNVKPPRRPDVTPRSYEAQIRVQPADEPNAGIEALLPVHVRSYGGFGTALANHNLEAGEPLRLYLHNQGSAPLTLTLKGRAPAMALHFGLPPEPLTLGPGQRTQLTGEITPRHRPWTGAPQVSDFVLQIQSRDPAGFVAALPGRITIEPRLPVWQLVTVGGLLLSFLLLAVYLLLNVLNAPRPAIQGLRVVEAQVPQGSPIVLEWNGFDLERIEVLVNQTRVTELDGSAQRAEIDTSELAGDLQITVLGENRGTFVEASVPVLVYPLLQMREFAVEPDQLVRNVVTTLTLRWEVAGAVRTRILGLENFSNAPLQNFYEGRGLLEGIGGYAHGTALVLTLYAEDAIGNILEEQLTIPVATPTCAPTALVDVREGPDMLYQAVGALPADLRVVAEAQDTSGTWLQVRMPLPGGEVLAWGRRSDFVCDSLFNPQTLRTEIDVPPLPTPFQSQASPTPFQPELTPTPGTLPTAMPGT